MKKFKLLTLVVIVSGCQTVPVVKNESWRNTKPTASEPRSAKLPEFQKTVLPNGLTLMVASNHHLPIVDLRLVIRAGSSRDALHKWGQASLCFDLLEEGAGPYDALQLTRAFADIGSQLHIATTQDFGVLELPILSQHLKRGLELLSIQAQSPHFKNKDLERVRTNYMSTLEGKKSSATAVAMDAFYENAYGKDHPYGHDSQGTLTSVPKITRHDVKQFWQDYFAPNQSAIVIVGDVTLQQAIEWVTQYFGKWKHDDVKAAVIPNPQSAVGGSIKKISRASSPQTFLAVGRPLVSANDPNRPTLDIMNEIIGGMFSSRLNMNLREAKSWSYGVRSQLNAWQHDGPWLASTSIQVPYAGQALIEIEKELAKMQDELVSDDELNMAKNGLLKSFPSRFETVETIAAAAAGLFVYNLPLDYFSQWQSKIALVTKEDVQGAAKKALQYKAMSIVAVGDMDTMKDF